jgi:hypothetical protein
MHHGVMHESCHGPLGKASRVNNRCYSYSDAYGLWKCEVPTTIKPIKGTVYVCFGVIEVVLKMTFVYFHDSTDVRHCVKQSVDTEITKCRILYGSTMFII